MPPPIREKYQLRLPAYPGVAQCVRIGGSAPTTGSAADGVVRVADMRISYGEDGGGGLMEDQVREQCMGERWYGCSGASGRAWAGMHLRQGGQGAT